MNKPIKQPPQNKPVSQPTQHIIATQTTAYSGPLPPAAELERLEQIKPGLVERVFEMAEREQSARLENEKILIQTETMAIKEEVSLKKRGQVIAIIAVLFIVALSGYGFYLGFAGAASTIACTVIVGLAGVFVYSKSKSRE